MYCLIKPCRQISVKLFSKIKLKHIISSLGIILVLDFFGVFTHVFEVPFDDNFVYPYEGDIHEFIIALRQNEKPTVPPINEFNFSFIHDVRNKCLEPNFKTLKVVLLIKSAAENFHRRMAIRNSWGFEKRFSDVPVKTIFLLGIHEDDNELKAKINLESVKYQDIVQINFIDSYYNNTIKTMMGFKWAVNYCSNSKFYMFVDDDMYVSLKNVLRFLRNPALYPDYLKDAVKFNNVQHLHNRLKRSNEKNIILLNHDEWINKSRGKYEINNLLINNIESNRNTRRTVGNVLKKNNKSVSKINLRGKRQLFDFELSDDVRLFAGYVFVSSPHRHKTSKWYVSLKEYPYHLWPPYVTAGAYIVSKEALIDMYYASMYTKFFKFDDIFLGLVAKKADIEPFHCEEFHFYKKDYTKYNYKYVISSHGYQNSEELLQVWNEQKAMGNA